MRVRTAWASGLRCSVVTMDNFFSVDWASLFKPTVPLAEIVVRGTVIYLLLFLFLRFLLKRESGMIGIADLLVVVLIADASQNAMASEYKSITEGVVLVVTIIFWDYALDWLAFRFPLFGRLLHPPPLELVRDGRINRRNMRKEMITENELMSQLREQGVDEVSQVKRACMEGDGRVSVIKKKTGGDAAGNRSPRKAAG